MKKFQKNCFQKNFFVLKNTQVVSAQISQKNFLGQIDLQFFFSSQKSAFFSMIFWLAPVDRKMLSGHKGGFIKEIVGGNTFILIQKDQKRLRVDAWESMS